MKNIISYGGGTQSTAMILMALNGEYELRRPDFAVFADTGGEPEFINEYVKYFKDYCKKKYNFDIYIIMHKNGLVHRMIHEEQKARNGKFYTSSTPPFFTRSNDGTIGMLHRQCTSDFKIHPINKYITSKIGRAVSYKIWQGISFEERQRMRINCNKKITNYYPLVDNYIKRIGSVKYVIDLGVRTPQRSSCYFCPYHSDRYWVWLQEHHLSEFEKACEFERLVQKRNNDYMTAVPFLHKTAVPLAEVNFNTDKDQLSLFPELIDECEGYCGI